MTTKTLAITLKRQSKNKNIQLTKKDTYFCSYVLQQSAFILRAVLQNRTAKPTFSENLVSQYRISVDQFRVLSE